MTETRGYNIGIESLIPEIQEELKRMHTLYQGLIMEDRTYSRGLEHIWRENLLRVEKLQAAIQQKLDGRT